MKKTLVVFSNKIWWGEESHSRMDPPVHLEHANTINVLDGTIARDVTIKISAHSGVIEAITPSDHAKEKGGRVDLVDCIDCSKYYCIRGLCDAHVHVTAFTADYAKIERTSSSYVACRAALILRDMLRRGFTTVRDMGGADLGLAEAVKEGLIPGPRLLACGNA